MSTIPPEAAVFPSFTLALGCPCSLRTVGVTVWGKLASDSTHSIDIILDQHPIVVFSSCRVTSFNGLSLNSLNGSSVAVNPDSKEAKKLKEWYEDGGCNQPTVQISEGLAGALTG